MYSALIFHSFNNNKNSDKFYDLKMEDYISLIDFLSKKTEAKQITLTFDDGFKSIIPAVEQALKKGYQTIAYIITDYIDKEGFLSRSDILYLHKIGCIIGSHTKSHRDLRKVNNAILNLELIESKNYLEKIIGIEINHFSFPYGSHNKYLLNRVRNIYRFNAISRPNFFKEENIIGRISINSFNCNNHKNILLLLKNDFSYRYLLRLFISFTLKKFLPGKFYIFLKNIISRQKSKDIFKVK